MGHRQDEPLLWAEGDLRRHLGQRLVPQRDALAVTAPLVLRPADQPPTGSPCATATRAAKLSPGRGGTGLLRPSPNSGPLGCKRGRAGVMSTAADLRLEPGPGERPVPFGSGRRDTQDCGRLIVGEAGEVTQFDKPRLAWVPRREAVERLVERDQILVRLRGGEFIEGLARRAATALEALLAARVVDENPPHGGRRGGEEVTA